MGRSHLKVTHKSFLKKRANGSACSAGGFTNPTLGQTIDSLQPLNITWDTTCLDSDLIDIILSAPSSDKPLLQGWEKVKFATGYKVVDLLPRKWNSTVSQQLQINLYDSGTPSFLSPLPAGPVFTATYKAPTDGSIPPQADISLNDQDSHAQSINSHSSKGLSPGKTAAAVLIPILLVLGAIYAYIKIQRRRGKEQRRRYAEAVDKRMSTISTDWKSMSVAGAQAAIRNSIAVNSANARNSAFSFGAIRPPSMATTTEPDMAQIRRPGVGLRNAALANAVASGEHVSRVSFADTTRVSRVSFAADPRPSTESRRTVGTVGSGRASRAYHTAYVPPVPTLPTAYTGSNKDGSSDEVDGNLSPRQTVGPLTLTPEDIRARIQGSRVSKEEDELDEVLPALSMMRTGSRLSKATTSSNPFSTTASHGAGTEEEDDGADEYILPPSNSSVMGPITIPEPTYFPPSIADTSKPMLSVTTGSSPTPLSPVSTSNLMSPIPANMMSPDDMLRAYAERKAAAAAATSTSPNNKSLHRTSSMSGFVGGFAIALGKKGKRKHERGSLIVSNPRPVTGMSISYPTPASPSPPTSATGAALYTDHYHTGMEGVGVYGGARYAIGDDEDEQYDARKAYGGLN